MACRTRGRQTSHCLDQLRIIRTYIANNSHLQQPTLRRNALWHDFGGVMRRPFINCLFLGSALALGAMGSARATEFYVGEPVTKNGMEIVANCLIGIEMK